MSGKNWDRVPIDAQSVDAPLSTAAVFLVVTVASEQAALAKVAAVLGDLDDLVKTVGFRDLAGRLSCIAGIGRDL
jgi:putative iron-dependent peroxidase